MSNGSAFAFYTLTPLHAGSGESAEVIDLPVQREKHTQYPVVYSSSLKGSLRYFFQCNAAVDEGIIETIFGKEGSETGAGTIVFTDAKILLFPVRSSEGVFKWITSPFVIERLKRDLKFIGGNGPLEGLSVPSPSNDSTVLALKPYANRILLEDFPVSAADISNDATVSKTVGFLKYFAAPFLGTEAEQFTERFLIVSDDLFKMIVTMATQVIARNELKDNKISNNLWYEEVVPADAVFYTLMKPAYRCAQPGGNDVMATLIQTIGNEIIQLGGNETVGYGFVKVAKPALEASLPPTTVKEEENGARGE